MSRTPFDQDRYDFSSRAHLKAKDEVYPKLFNQEELEFVDLNNDKGKMMDYEEGVDSRVRVMPVGLKDKLSFDFQYRFRQAKYIDYQDITITEWCYNSASPSELYKIRAHLFLYGYYDAPTNNLLEAIVFHVSPVLLLIAQGKLAYRRSKNNKNQSFITISLHELKQSGAIALHMRGGKVV